MRFIKPFRHGFLGSVIGVLWMLGGAECSLAQNGSLLQGPLSGDSVPNATGDPQPLPPPPAVAGGSGSRSLPAGGSGSPTVPTSGSGTRSLPAATAGGSGSRSIPPPEGSGSPAYPSSTAYGFNRSPIGIQGASWTYQPAPPIRTFRKHDIVTIRVDEITRVMAEGASESRKRTLYEAVLSDWIRITDFRLRPDPQGNGDPTVATESNNNYRAEATVESRESLTFNIAATVVDIRPNGTLVLEATKAIRVNDNLWETSLTGICRAQDIAPDNVVLSKDLIDLEIQKQDRGHLRDGYQRGWFQRWFDRVQPF